jgi:hypothetical protein
MPKYEAVIDITVEVEAYDSEEADKLILGELTHRLLASVTTDDLFKVWLDVREIEEMS